MEAMRLTPRPGERRRGWEVMKKQLQYISRTHEVFLFFEKMLSLHCFYWIMSCVCLCVFSISNPIQFLGVHWSQGPN